MVVPYFQLLAGLTIGIIGFFLLRPKQIEYHHEENRRQRRRSFLSTPDDNCCICLKTLSEEPMTYINCGHALHDTCLRILRGNSKVCPLCRKNL